MLSQMAAPQDVFSLLEAVKQVEKPKLDAVAVGELQLFQNERAKKDSELPIANNIGISDLVAVGSFEEPLYVFHGASLRETSVEARFFLHLVFYFGEGWLVHVHFWLITRSRGWKGEGRNMQPTEAQERRQTHKASTTIRIDFTRILRRPNRHA